jgi:hypothetical protein
MRTTGIRRPEALKQRSTCTGESCGLPPHAVLLQATAHRLRRHPATVAVGHALC